MVISGFVPSASPGLNQGSHFDTGSSRESAPCSTRARAAALTMGLVMEASRKTVSTRMGVCFSRSAQPQAFR